MEDTQSVDNFHQICHDTNLYGSLTLYALSACLALACLWMVYTRNLLRNCPLVSLLLCILVFSASQTVTYVLILEKSFSDLTAAIGIGA